MPRRTTSSTTGSRRPWPPATATPSGAAHACNYSPARVPAAMTISATDSTDKKASWANYGNCVDWFAPGVNITSAWFIVELGDEHDQRDVDGDATHGWGGRALPGNHPTASPATVRDALFNATTKGVVTSSSTTNNHLLYSLFPSGGGTAPTAAFSGTPTSGQAPTNVQFTDASTGSPTSWSWSFGDGGSATTQNPSHSYAAGTYTVTLTATNASGSDPETKTNYITVSPAPTPAPTPTPTPTPMATPTPTPMATPTPTPARSRSACARTRSRGTRPPTSRGRAPPGRT